MAFEKDENEIGCLWTKTSKKGVEFMSGTINGVEVVCFRANKKSERQPDWRVLKSQPRDGQNASTRRLDTREGDRRASRVDDADREYTDEDLGF